MLIIKCKNSCCFIILVPAKNFFHEFCLLRRRQAEFSSTNRFSAPPTFHPFLPFSLPSLAHVYIYVGIYMFIHILAVLPRFHLLLLRFLDFRYISVKCVHIYSQLTYISTTQYLFDALTLPIIHDSMEIHDSFILFFTQKLCVFSPINRQFSLIFFKHFEECSNLFKMKFKITLYLIDCEIGR